VGELLNSVVQHNSKSPFGSWFMVFGFFNLGAQEMLILLFLLFGGLCFAGVLASTLVVVVLLTRRQNRDATRNPQAASEAEIQRLREELARLKKDRI
jgi:hypothetical protein